MEVQNGNPNLAKAYSRSLISIKLVRKKPALIPGWKSFVVSNNRQFFKTDAHKLCFNVQTS